MSVERTQVMQFEIQTSASGNGLRMTAEQMKELEARIDALNSKSGKSPADLLQLGHMKNALFFAQQAGVAEEAKGLGAQIGEHAGAEAGEHLKKHILKHLANIGGEAFGVGGAGGGGQESGGGDNSLRVEC